MRANYLKIFMFLCAFLIVHNSVLNAQEKQFEIRWSAPVNVATTEKPLMVPSFEKAHFSYSVSEGLRFVDKWKVSAVFDASSAQLDNVVYETISSTALKDLKLELIPDTSNLKAAFSKIRGASYFQFSISPIVKINGTVKRITRFSIRYNAQRKPTIQQSRLPGRSNSILASGDFYKFHIDTTGVFRLDYEFLERLGMDVQNINPQLLKIYGDGGAMLPLKNSDNTILVLRRTR